jgi:hypothetical protein
MKTERQTAEYVAEMILELRNLSKGKNMEDLRALLEISYYEAYGVAHAVDVPEGEQQHLDQIGDHARRFAAA